MSRRKHFSFILITSFMSGVLLWLAWPERGFTPLIFFAFVPLFFAEHSFSTVNKSGRGFRMFGNFYLALLTWNALTTWWIYNATDAGSFIAIGLNSLFMTVPWYLYFHVRSRHGTSIGYLSLIIFWIAFEYLHLNWEISWPWLTLGNVFSTHPEWIQWYEFTGTLGGSAWVLMVNILIFQLIKSIWYKDLLVRIRSINVLILSGIIFFVVAGPLISSLYVYYDYEDVGEPAKAILLQPNQDPYNEKFNQTGLDQTAELITLVSPALDSSTEYVIAPETAIADGIRESEAVHDPSVRMLRSAFSRFPKLNMIVGLTSFRTYAPNETRTVTARKSGNGNSYYDVFNSAMLISNNDPLQIYHKSRLVPGVEKMPYPKIFGFLERYAIKLGGTSGSLGTQKNRSNMIAHDGTRIAPAICYESIYGDFMSAYIRDSAEFIAIITNDGWWGNTPGYRQHMNYARLRAVEFRKSIARSANTGISCFINQRGDIVSRTEWWVEDKLSGFIYKNKVITFYAQHGDYIGFACAFFAVTLLIYLFLRRLILWF